MFLAWLNYRGVLATLTFNLVITAIAFIAIIVLFVCDRRASRRRASCSMPN